VHTHRDGVQADQPAEIRAYLSGRGVDLSGEQQTKTCTAHEHFAAELS
jgi:hypothetical protein